TEVPVDRRLALDNCHRPQRIDRDAVGSHLLGQAMRQQSHAELRETMDTLDITAYTEGVASFQSLRRFAMRLSSPDAGAFAFSYLRFSSPAQADGDSVRRQTALRDGWLKRHPAVRLDTSLRLEDKGVSGYRGEHRTNKRHALAAFLDLVERGR